MTHPKKSFSVSDLRVKVGNKTIINGVSLTVRPGQIHAVMGPNGSGKSTLASSLMGHPDYTVVSGKVIMDGINITKFSPDRRAKQGLFLGLQYPVEVPGVSLQQFLRLAVSKAGLKKPPSPIALRSIIADRADQLSLAGDISSRSVNLGFSGGEKKKSEILQLAVLRPKYAILDEPDSGLDVDALKYISNTVNSLSPRPGLIIITHYQRLLRYIKPDFVHIMVGGRIIKSGSGKLAGLIEKSGYEGFTSLK